MSTIISFFENLLKWVVHIAKAVWDWLVDWITKGIDVLLSPLVDAIPDISNVWDTLRPLSPYTAFLNQWIALDYAITLLSAYFTYIAIMISVKLIIKLFVPTVG